MKRLFLAINLILIALFVPVTLRAQTESNRKERQAITEGNRLYNDGRYRAAMLKYREALEHNPSSAVAKYNLGLSQIRLGSNPSDTTQTAKDMLQKGSEAMEQVARYGGQKPLLASQANYNLGNVAFNAEDYKQALNYYKQSLRLNPDDAAAKRNLRITQLKLQNQNENKDDNKNQDQNQDQDQQQDQNQNQDQQQDQNQERQPPQTKDQNRQDLNQQTADQILQAMENKENQTRTRQGTNQAQEAKGRNRNTKNW